MINPQSRHLHAINNTPQPPQHHSQQQQQPPPPIRPGMNPPQPIRMNLHNGPGMPPFPPRHSPPNLESGNLPNAPLLSTIRSIANDTDTKHVPCKFYPLGTCNAGDACKFSHNLETAQDRQPCRYFQKGNCKFGAKCALLHIIDGRLVNDPIGQNNVLPGGFQRQMVIGGPPASQVSGLTMQLGNNQPPQAAGYNTTNGFQSSYFPPTSPTMNDGGSFGHNSPPSPPKYRSGLSSALRNHEMDSGEISKSGTSIGLLGPLDAQFPASVDLSNNHIARNGPFAASVPSKFGLPPQSGMSSIVGSIRERGMTSNDYPASGTTTPIYDPFGSRYGSPMETSPWPQDGFSRSTAGSLLQQSIHQSRNLPTSPLHSRPQSSSSPFIPFENGPKPPTTPPTSRLPHHLTKPRLTPISSSVPAAHFGEKIPFSPHPIEDDEALDTDVLPSSLHDEVLLPQELNRRSSTSHTPGLLNRRSSAYDEFARSPPSGAVTPGSERGGGTSLPGSSPGSSRMESLWGKIVDSDQLENATPSRQRVASPLRNTIDPTVASSRVVGVKTASGHAAQKWGGRSSEKLFPHPSSEVHGVNVPGVVWRRKAGEGVMIGRGELTNEDVRRIKEEEEGTPFSME